MVSNKQAAAFAVAGTQKGGILQTMVAFHVHLGSE